MGSNMDSKEFDLYKDIRCRTNGEIYIGVVGPVRTGKSTFIKHFMELCVIPKMDNEYAKKRAVDELPQSGKGKTIMTTEPKFIPQDAVTISLDDGSAVKVRLVDCVGFTVGDAVGYLEEDGERMVKTPWFDEDIPFEEAAVVGTKKVIEEHSTVAVLVTTDGSIGDIKRQTFITVANQRGFFCSDLLYHIFNCCIIKAYICNCGKYYKAFCGRNETFMRVT